MTSPDSATSWSRCGRCRLPGLALVSHWSSGDPATPKCGFCGGKLKQVEQDLSREAEAVIARPQCTERVAPGGVVR